MTKTMKFLKGIYRPFIYLSKKMCKKIELNWNFAFIITLKEKISSELTLFYREICVTSHSQELKSKQLFFRKYLNSAFKHYWHKFDNSTSDLHSENRLNSWYSNNMIQNYCKNQTFLSHRRPAILKIGFIL
jgi:hypothetical protein